MPAATHPGLASVARSPAERSPGTASSSATTSAQNTARLMTLLRRRRVWAASARSRSPRCPARSPSSARSSPPSLGNAIAAILAGRSAIGRRHPRAVPARALAKARGRHTEAPAKGMREVGGLTVADQACDVGDRDRRLLVEQRRRRREPPCAQVLLEAQAAKLLVRPLDLARGAAQHARD